MSAGPNRRNIQAYEDAYSSDYDFELVQDPVPARRSARLPACARKPEYVIEIGCGLEPLLPHYIAGGGTGITRWVVGRTFGQVCAGGKGPLRRIARTWRWCGVFEDLAERIVEEYGQADMVICSGLLHEVLDQRRLLARSGPRCVRMPCCT